MLGFQRGGHLAPDVSMACLSFLRRMAASTGGGGMPCVCPAFALCRPAGLGEARKGRQKLASERGVWGAMEQKVHLSPVPARKPLCCLGSSIKPPFYETFDSGFQRGFALRTKNKRAL